jgi:hypothetical protein
MATAPARPAPSRPIPGGPTGATGPRPTTNPRPNAPAKEPSRSAAVLDLSPRKPQPPCPRMLMYAAEKFGKTTLGAYAPDPIILMARGETGYDTLLGAGLAPAVPALVMESFDQTLETLDIIIANPQGRKTVVLDAHGGFERLCHEKVVTEKFKGEWGDAGFLSYNKGPGIAVTEWLKLIQRLDQLHDKHGIIVVFLAHAKVKPFNDPMGPAYDRYICDAHETTWAVTARWSDCILFGKFFTVVEAEDRGKKKATKGKGIGGTDRVIHTKGCDAFVAGNRYGMTPEIWLPSAADFQGSADPEAEARAAMWSTVWNEIVRDKSTPV